MRNRSLHAALAAFAEEAAHQLAADTADGAEVPFEVVELGGTRREAPLYCYRPLTASFIDERLSILGRLASYLPAVHAPAARSRSRPSRAPAPRRPCATSSRASSTSPPTSSSAPTGSPTPTRSWSRS